MLTLLVGKLNSEQGTECATEAFSTVAAPSCLTAFRPGEGKQLRHEAASIIRPWQVQSEKHFSRMNYFGIDLDYTSPCESPLGQLPHSKR